MTSRLFALTLLALPLAGCAPAPVAPIPEPVVDMPAPAVASVSGVAGLQTREPDSCGARNFASAVGQPSSVIPTLGVTREYRVVEFRGIEPQEYNALRMVFRLDQNNTITAVSCG
ncbi:MAG: hypothetical protein DI498_02740 [Paracoccus denitrificans]|nr:MAG: hypothetical protein DI498_02740 [Paracoccus denitrificans]PZO85459.1 MAG: hypothetical protein DI633_02740 [Paracoccus denitrificans]